jgi:hypothetical protein
MIIDSPEAANPLYSNTNSVEFTKVPGSEYRQSADGQVYPAGAERTPDYPLEMAIEALDDRYSFVIAAAITGAVEELRGIVDDADVRSQEARIDGLQEPTNDILASWINWLMPGRNN